MGDPTVGRRLIAPVLWARGVTRIDTIFLSHADSDHYDGLADLLDRFPIGAVRITPGFATESNPRAVQLIDQIKARGIPVQPVTAPQSWEQAGVRFTVLHPPAGWHPETPDNARSLVLDIAFAGRHLLLTGDLEQLGLVELVGRSPPQPPPDVFLAPHHGGRSANPEWLYEWAKPRLVVVSQRPLAARTRDALSVVERREIPLLRTWRDGSIRLRWTTGGITHHGFLEQRDDQPAWRAQGTFHLMVGLVGFALGAIACLVLAVVEFGAWVLVVPPRSIRDGADPATDPAVREPQRLSEPLAVRASDGARLAGRWLRAPGPAATGRTVLLLHGFAEDSSAWEARRVGMLHRHGWNVAALDSRGYGQSEGPYASFGGREAGDVGLWLLAIAEHVSKLDPIVTFRPALWGRSMGAAIAVRAAAQDMRIAALVLESPLVDLDATVAVLLGRRRLPFPNLLARLVTRRAGKLAGISLERPRSIDLAREIKCPALIVHGTDDMLVPIEQARSLANAFPSPPCWLDVPGAGHPNVIGVGGDELVERIAVFLDEAINSAEPARSEPPGES